jgi:hypothetical protein
VLDELVLDLGGSNLLISDLENFLETARDGELSILRVNEPFVTRTEP